MSRTASASDSMLELAKERSGCTCESKSGVASTTYSSRHLQLGALLEHGPRTFPLSLPRVGPSPFHVLLSLSRRHRESNTQYSYTLYGLTYCFTLRNLLICSFSPPFASLPHSTACRIFFRPPCPQANSSAKRLCYPNTEFWLFYPARSRRPQGDNRSTRSHHSQRVVECLVVSTRSRATLGRHCAPSSHFNAPLLLSYRPLSL
jgi:hypothetical protein